MRHPTSFYMLPYSLKKPRLTNTSGRQLFRLLVVSFTMFDMFVSGPPLDTWKSIPYKSIKRQVKGKPTCPTSWCGRWLQISSAFLFFSSTAAAFFAMASSANSASRFFSFGTCCV